MIDNAKPTGDDAPSHEANPTVHDSNVAVPEVRTGRVDVEGDFHRDQNHPASHAGVTFDTLAVPEYHTGKCPDYDPDCVDEANSEHSKKHRHGNSLFDLARILANGGPEEK